MKYRPCLPLMLFIAMSAQAFSQDPVSAHFFANSILLNPALAGVEGPVKIHTGYRNQWPNTGSSFVTYQAAYDQFIEPIDGGLGIQVLNDKQGDGAFNSYNLDIMYSHQFAVSRRLSFSGGLQAGIGQRSFNPVNLRFGDMIDPVTGNTTALSEEILGYSEFYPDFAVGIAAFYDYFHGGASIRHIFNPVIIEGDTLTGTISRKYAAYVGAVIPVIERRRGKEIMKLSPSMVFIQQRNVQQINYGLDVIFRDFLAGLHTRHDLSLNYGNIIFSAGYISTNFRFRYSYDMRLSSPTIRLPNMGAHEFSLIFIYNNEGKRKHTGTIKCPKI